MPCVDAPPPPHLGPVVLLRLLLLAHCPALENHPSPSSRLTLEVLEDFLSSSLFPVSVCQAFGLIEMFSSFVRLWAR